MTVTERVLDGIGVADTADRRLRARRERERRV
jgi:hypothetical protein